MAKRKGLRKPPCAKADSPEKMVRVNRRKWVAALREHRKKDEEVVAGMIAGLGRGR